jgi:cyanophycinase
MSGHAGGGVVALVGGGEWGPGADFDAELLRRGGEDVLVLPTAAAYEHPERAVATASEWFGGLGGRVEGLMVLTRRDAEEERYAAAVRKARFVYLAGGSPLHLRAVLKGSAVFAAILHAWREGAVIAGSSAGAMVLTDPMIDPRGGAFTVGLGLIEQLAVIPHLTDPHSAQVQRTLGLAPAGLAVACIPERTALVRDPDGTWTQSGVGEVLVYVDHKEADLSILP